MYILFTSYDVVLIRNARQSYMRPLKSPSKKSNAWPCIEISWSKHRRSTNSPFLRLKKNPVYRHISRIVQWKNMFFFFLSRARNDICPRSFRKYHLSIIVIKEIKYTLSKFFRRTILPCLLLVYVVFSHLLFFFFFFFCLPCLRRRLSK